MRARGMEGDEEQGLCPWAADSQPGASQGLAWSSCRRDGASSWPAFVSRYDVRGCGRNLTASSPAAHPPHRHQRFGRGMEDFTLGSGEGRRHASRQPGGGHSEVRHVHVSLRTAGAREATCAVAAHTVAHATPRPVGPRRPTALPVRIPRRGGASGGAHRQDRADASQRAVGWRE